MEGDVYFETISITYHIKNLLKCTQKGYMNKSYWKQTTCTRMENGLMKTPKTERELRQGFI